MSILCLPRKLLIAALLLYSIVGFAQRPRWSSHTYGLTGLPTKVVVADVNGDGISDQVIAIPSMPEVAVLLGNGNGTFQSPKYTPYDGRDIVVADLNGDHKADLATPERLYIGSGDGYFQYNSLLPQSGDFIFAGDFNKDGKTDLVVTTAVEVWEPIVISTLLGDGHGNFTFKEGYSGPGPYWFGTWFSTDLNGDSKPDLVIEEGNKAYCYEDGYCDPPNSILVLMGKGDGSFVAASGEPSFNSGLYASPGLGDVNGDKKLDLVLAGQLPSSATPALQVHTYFGKGDGTFQPLVSANTSCAAPFAMGDLNGDGRSDLLCDLNGKITFYSSNGNGSYTQGTVFTGLSTNGIVIADLNKDGTKDAILLNAGSSLSVTVLLNLSGASMSASTTPSTLVYKQPFSLGAFVGASITQTPHPTGSVTYKDGTSTLGGAPLASALNVSAGLTVGTHSFSATYGGDGKFNPQSVSISRTVAKAASSTKLTSSLNSSTHGQFVTFTATVAPQYGGTPTGKITFKDGTTVLATVTMSSGKATYTKSSLSVGTHSITAAYSGDGNFKASTSAVLYQR